MRASTAAERDQTEEQIGQTSTTFAEMIRSGLMPGCRATRDAYCRAHRAGVLRNTRLHG